MREQNRPAADHGRARSTPPAPLSAGKPEGRLGHVITIPIDVVRLADSPRLTGEISGHVQRLAESDATLPPIIVHSGTMRVIDGMHRLKAAALRGDTHIRARLYDGAADDAFVLAVRTNATHGLPLSLEDRVHAATRIVGSHAAWSDRAIAATVGLSPKTVAAIRLRVAEDPGPGGRIGRDGRTRPSSTAVRRQLAGELIQQCPEASLRQIAGAVGLAPSTVLDVRTRLRAGRDLVPGNQRTTRQPADIPPPRRRRPPEGDPPEPSIVDRARAVGALMQDPTLRFSDTGRRLLRWLEAQPTAFSDWQQVVDNVPEHWLAVVVELARDGVRAWTAVVDRLERRAHHPLVGINPTIPRPR